MRVCPNCEYIDPPYWKHVKYSYYIDSCSYENFKILFPDLAKQIEVAGFVEDKHYVYRAVRQGKSRKKFRNDPIVWIERKAKVDFTIGWSDATENAKPRLGWGKVRLGTHSIPHDFQKSWMIRHPSQKKLSEKLQKTQK